MRASAKMRRSADHTEAEAGAYALAAEIAAMDVETAWVIACAFALYFDLVNTAEDNARMNVLRQEAFSKSPEPVHDSIEEAVRLLKASGMTRKQMAELLENLSIELVLTAHPTEARRRTVLSKMARIAEVLRALGSGQLLPGEQERCHQVLHNEVTTLWLTDRARSAQPTPTDEVRTALYFVGQIFWTALPQIYEILEDAVEKYYPGLKVDHPWLRLASWMGGDRDGNPNVTTEVTAETLTLHRGLAVELTGLIQDLSRRLSLSSLHYPTRGAADLAGPPPAPTAACRAHPGTLPPRALPADPRAAGQRPG